MNTGRDAGIRKNRSTRPAPRPAATPGASSDSNFRLPVTTTRAGSAPMSMMRRADSSLCMQNRSTSASTRRKNPRASRYRGYDRDEIRPFTSIVFTPCRRQARSRFGQISVSIMMNSRGLTSRSVRLTNGGRSNGKKKTASTSWRRDRAICWPVSVVVDRKIFRPGIALAQIREQRPRGQRLAHRDGVNPDRLVAVEIEADRQIAHPLGEAADVLPVPDRLIQEPRRQHDRQNDDGQRVERVHVSE